MNRAPSVAVLAAEDDPDAAGVAAALRQAFGAAASPAQPTDDPGEGEAGRAAPIALPVDEPEAEPPIDRADAVVALDPESADRARRAGARRLVVFPFHLGLDAWEGELAADLVLLTHEGLVDDAVERGARPSQLEVCGPVAPAGWAPAEDRAGVREALGGRVDAPWVVVGAAALEEQDLAPALVQLSLVGEDAVWLFDVGSDADRARALRRRVPGHGLDAVMFADGPQALEAYRAADVVLGRVAGPEAVRAVAVGASLALVSPRRSQLRAAHWLESAGWASVADAPATLSVTLDAALRPSARRRPRGAEAVDAAQGAARAAELVSELLRGRSERRGRRPSGLPIGLERLDPPEEQERRGPPASEPPHEPRPRGSEDDDLDRKVDEELAALREKLGL